MLRIRSHRIVRDGGVSDVFCDQRAGGDEASEEVSKVGFNTAYCRNYQHLSQNVGVTRLAQVCGGLNQRCKALLELIDADDSSISWVTTQSESCIDSGGFRRETAIHWPSLIDKFFCEPPYVGCAYRADVRDLEQRLALLVHQDVLDLLQVAVLTDPTKNGLAERQLFDRHG